MIPIVKVIVGATATGKTRHALEMAKSCNGEIINCDSLQLYKELKTLTALPTDEEMHSVKHRLFSYLNYDQRTSSVDWAKLAAKAIQETIESGKKPIIVGGTGLYIKTLIEGISPMPTISDKNRQKAKEFSEQNFNEMCEELYSIDPNLRHMLPQSMHHQLIRAYEIFLETSKSIRYFLTLPKIKFIQDVNFDIEVLHCARALLYERIARRFEQMLYNGAIDEVRTLLSKIAITNHTEIFTKFPIFKAIGAKEITMFLSGIYTFEQMKEVSIKNSRHYAKRQITWFKHQISVGTINL